MLYQTTLFRERCKSGIIYLNGWMSHMTLHLKGHFNVLIFNPPPQIYKNHSLNYLGEGNQYLPEDLHLPPLPPSHPHPHSPLQGGH